MWKVRWRRLGLLAGVAACTSGVGCWEPETNAPSPAPPAPIDSVLSCDRERVVCDGPRTVLSALDLEALADCGSITGSLVINAPDIEDLAPLTCLQEVQGNLQIGGDIAIRTFDLVEPGEHIFGPARLRSLRGLEGLVRIGGELRLGSRLTIQGGPLRPETTVSAGPVALRDLVALAALEEVSALVLQSTRTGQLAPPDRWTVGMPSLTDLSALDGVAAESVLFDQTGELVTALPRLALNDNARITLNRTAFTSIVGPSYPDSLSLLELTNNAALTSLDGLSSVGAVESLVIVDNPSLNDLSGLSATRATELIIATEEVTPSRALHITEVVDTTFVVGSTSALAELTKTGALQTGLLPDGRFGSSDASGLISLERVERDARLHGLAGDDLSELGGLLFIGGELSIIEADVSSFEGLASELSVGALTIIGANEIVDLTGLEGIDEVGTLRIIENPTLESLAGLGVTTVRDGAEIHFNIRLGQCAVDELLDRLGLPPDEGVVRFDGTRTTGNNPTCTCVDGVPVGCLECLLGDPNTGFVVAVPEIQEAECFIGSQGILFTNVDELELPNLRYAEDLYISSSSIRTISFPLLEQVRRLDFSGGDGLPPLTSASLPSLRTAESITVLAHKPSLTDMDLSALETVGALTVKCTPDGCIFNGSLVQCEPGEVAPPAVPLESLALDSLLEAGSIVLTDCATLPRCELDFDLAGAAVSTVDAVGLDEQCQCDATGAAINGTCAVAP